MSDHLFPRTTVEGVSLSRMIIGTNWMLGWSHTSPAADHQIKRRYADGANAFPMLKTFLDRGVDTIMGMLQQEQVMRDAIPCLNEGGRLAIITFHSLEDRIVKNGMVAASKGCTCPPNFPVCVCGNKPKVKLVSKKPIVSGEEELERNPRARSAKLRVCEKL